MNTVIVNCGCDGAARAAMVQAVRFVMGEHWSKEFLASDRQRWCRPGESEQIHRGKS